jgi:hypothetical protein
MYALDEIKSLHLERPSGKCRKHELTNFWVSNYITCSNCWNDLHEKAREILGATQRFGGAPSYYVLGKQERPISTTDFHGKVVGFYFYVPDPDSTNWNPNNYNYAAEEEQILNHVLAVTELETEDDEFDISDEEVSDYSEDLEDIEVPRSPGEISSEIRREYSLRTRSIFNRPSTYNAERYTNIGQRRPVLRVD